MKSKKIKKLIDKYEYVSFDIFDTLIVRILPKSTDKFLLLEELYNKKSINKIENFKEIRKRAEIAARNKKKTEITIYDIYNEIKYSKDCKEILLKLEKETEIDICFFNNNISDIYKYCLDNDKKIIITSDMYLDYKTISKILKKNKIKYHKLFLSSELAKTKANGDIFPYILSNLNIEKKDIIHIGDNLKSDFIMPKLNGINCIYFKKSNTKHNKDYKINFLNEFIDHKYNLLKDTGNEYFEFGYKNLGPLVYGFCEYIHENLNKNNKLFFLAREGKFIKECYEQLYDFENNKINYLYVSRKSILKYYVNNKTNFEELIKNMSFSKFETIEMFMKRLDLYNDENINYLINSNIELDSLINTKKNINFFKNNFKNLSFNNNEKLLLKYLEQFEFNSNSILVDIGWKGTMQDMLCDITNQKVIGFYLGVRKQKNFSNKNGYIYNPNNEKMEIYSRSMNDFIEILFSANHGSTIDYRQNNKIIEPILIENDIPVDVMANIEKIQNGAKLFINDYKNFNSKLNLNSFQYCYNLYNVGLHPKLEHIKLFNNFKTFDQKYVYLLSQKNLVYYIFHFKELYKDYISSGWKNGFLKKIFKLDFNYHHFFYILYKINDIGDKK